MVLCIKDLSIIAELLLDSTSCDQVWWLKVMTFQLQIFNDQVFELI
jgi:hypothetical protein